MEAFVVGLLVGAFIGFYVGLVAVTNGRSS